MNSTLRKSNGGTALQQIALVLFIRDDSSPQVLLGRRKTGPGRGRFAAIGGRLKSGESPRGAAAREIHEELGVQVAVDQLRPAARLTFLFPSNPSWNEIAHVFLVNRWEGEPLETEEVAPSWFTLTQVPFDRMWEDYGDWLPAVIGGTYSDAAYTYASDNQTIKSVERESRSLGKVQLS